jgi:hypothetical protein
MADFVSQSIPMDGQETAERLEITTMPSGAVKVAVAKDQESDDEENGEEVYVPPAERYTSSCVNTDWDIQSRV